MPKKDLRKEYKLSWEYAQQKTCEEVYKQSL